jgi:hypothetical protein
VRSNDLPNGPALSSRRSPAEADRAIWAWQFIIIFHFMIHVETRLLNRARSSSSKPTADTILHAPPSVKWKFFGSLEIPQKVDLFAWFYLSFSRFSE